MPPVLKISRAINIYKKSDSDPFRKLFDTNSLPLDYTCKRPGGLNNRWSKEVLLTIWKILKHRGTIAGEMNKNKITFAQINEIMDNLEHVDIDSLEESVYRTWK